MKILVICNNGNSSSVLAQKINKVATEKGLEHTAEAVPPFNAKDRVNEFDVVLIAPQIKFDLQTYQALHPKVEVIPPMIFGMMDGIKAIELAEEVLGK